MDTYLWIILGTTIVYFLYKWLTKNYDYFEEKGVAHKKPIPIFGNSLEYILKRLPITEALVKQYQEFPNEKIVGAYNFMSPVYIIRDPNLIKQITIKDFDHFVNHKSISELDKNELFASILTILTDQKWKNMRATLSPAFTGSKMKMMLQLINECGERMVQHLFKKIETNSSQIIIDAKSVFSTFTNDVIASCAFGISIDSMQDKDNELIKMAHTLLNANQFLAIVKFVFIKGLPTLAKLLGISLENKKLNKQFKDLMMDNIYARERDNIVRPDMIHLLMQARKGELKDDNEKSDNIDMTTLKWNDTELIAQCFLFFIAGYETTSMVLSFAAYELAINKNVQEKLIAEIDKVSYKLDGNKLTYSDLQSMEYLDMVFSETLRKWPPGVATDRLCTKDYVLNDNDGNSILIENGKQIILPIYGIHHDPKYFPNPNVFDPERFSSENQKEIISGTYIPFGLGPRNCIASRFALMEIKCVMFHLLQHFTFEVCDKTLIPMKTTMMKLIPDAGIHLALKKR